MIPAALVATLAIVRLGAVHATVFGGFASTALANRMEAAKPKLIMTASCGIEGNKGPINYKPLVEGAIEKSSWKPSRTIIWQRDESQWRPINHVEGNQRCWQKLVKSAKSRGIKAEAVPVKSSDGLYIIYTSGTTGSPKGILREAGGHAVGLSLSARHMFDLHGPGDVMFCASDIGWVVGHSYIIYSPLLVGATTLLFEGKPVYTPDAGIFWRLIEEHKVKTLSTAPTALRAIHKYDEDFSLFKQVAERGGLKSLQGLFLVGERSEPSIVTRFQDLLTKYAAPEAKVIDNWWSSESGSPMTGLRIKSPRSAIKPGSAGKLMPGFDVRIVNDEGEEQKPGSMGNVVLKTPLGPTAFTTLFKDPERFYKGYLRRFNDKWMDTGDAGYIDENGYVHIMARSDDIINVAAHRFSTGAIEQVVLSHPDVVEACVVGIPDT
ncbi:Acyl-CoA synthetase short-chain member 3, mitochondrial, partial [Ascosphaera atra]